MLQGVGSHQLQMVRLGWHAGRGIPGWQVPEGRDRQHGTEEDGAALDRGQSGVPPCPLREVPRASDQGEVRSFDVDELNALG